MNPQNIEELYNELYEMHREYKELGNELDETKSQVAQLRAELLAAHATTRAFAAELDRVRRHRPETPS